MEKPTKGLKGNQMHNVSQRYVNDEELRDTPARLFRKILNKMEMNPRKWTMYLRDYLDWVVTTIDREKAKNERITRTGNIKDTYFQKPTLTFNKMLEGLSILKQDTCEIIIRVTDEDGNVIEVSEKLQIVGADRREKTSKDSAKSTSEE